jgi:IclR family acetate operon transcriptional repressor
MEQTKRKRGRPKSTALKPPEVRIQSLDRAIDILEHISHGSGLTLSEIAENTGQSPATLYRILTTCAARHLVEIDPVTQEWHIGPQSFRIGSAFLQRSGIVERARPMMRALMHETGETANLGVESNRQVLFLSQVETPENIRAFFPPGAQSPMHASGIGKALLAFADHETIESYLKSGQFEAFTENTIHRQDDLQAELARIRTQGYAFDNEEKSKGMRCVAAPILNSYGEVVAGLSVSGPTARMTLERIDTISAQVMKQAETLSFGLGFSGR